MCLFWYGGRRRILLRSQFPGTIVNYSEYVVFMCSLLSRPVLLCYPFHSGAIQCGPKVCGSQNFRLCDILVCSVTASSLQSSSRFTGTVLIDSYVLWCEMCCLYIHLGYTLSMYFFPNCSLIFNPPPPPPPLR